MTYPLTFYTNSLAAWQAGCANGPLIRIRPEYKDDVGLYRHELTHVKQWAVPSIVGAVAGAVAALAGLTSTTESLLLGTSLGAMFHPLMYLWVRRYRQWAEVQAYRVQMRYPDRLGGQLTLDKAALRLALPQYDLGITQGEAKAALS